MSTQFPIADGGHVSLACGPFDSFTGQYLIRLDITDRRLGTHSVILLGAVEAKQIAKELLRRAAK